jgi:hypothetical protein
VKLSAKAGTPVANTTASEVLVRVFFVLTDVFLLCMSRESGLRVVQAPWGA